MRKRIKHKSKTKNRKITMHKKTMKQQPKIKLSFYDVKGRKKFKSSDYKIKIKKGRRFAIADAPSGIKAWRILGRA